MRETRPAWLPVARWEMYRILRRKDFLVSIIITPLILYAGTHIVALLEHKGDRKVAVSRNLPGDRWLRGPAALAPLPGYAWVDPGAAGADSAVLAAALKARTYEAALVIRTKGSGAWQADLFTRREPPRWTGELRAHLDTSAHAERVHGMGLSAAQLAALDDTVEVRSRVVLGGRSGSRVANFLVTFGALMLMISVLLSSMSYMMVGISGEKQARVTEVVLSAIPAQDWMDGKIVAFTAIGLITGVVWATTLLVIAGPLTLMIPGAVNPLNLLVTLVFALLGLYLYNALFSGLMATAQNLQTASKWQGNFVLLPFIPLLFIRALMENPDSLAMILLSQVPFFTPIMLPARLVVGAAQPWEIALGIVMMIAACYATRVFAGRVFRLGMLMYGKDMSVSELIRWARVR